MLWDAIDQLQAIDFGYAEQASDAERERLLRRLEDVVDDLSSVGLDFPEGERCIRYFLTEPALARTYLYGPTDLGDGRGLIEKLKELALQREGPEDFGKISSW